MKFWIALAAAACATLASVREVRAEELMMDGVFGLGTGIEGGDPGTGLSWRRARLRVLGGVDLRSDEGQADALGFRAFVEVEKRASVGAEVRYERWMARNFGVWANLSGTVTPETLFGGGFGCTAILPFGKKFGLFLEPSFQAMPLGSDTPGDSILVWGLLSAGVRFGL
ncbi:MAG: hypothetical protein EOO73_04125 [Myxococcales bacterium]|nr:MAG: hypothetical protein EOO73_04125 [Myxococcales bacterium]